MKLGRIVASLAVSLACYSTAQEAAKPAQPEKLTPEQMMQKVAEFMKKSADISERSTNATEEIRTKQQAARAQQNQLASPYDPARVAELEKRLANQKAYVTRLEAELVVANVKSPEERAKKKAELDAQVKEMSKEYQKLSAPFSQERNALFQEARPVSDALKEILTSAVLKPADLEVVSARVNANAESGFCSVHWNGAENKQLAWAHIWVLPAREEFSGEEKVAGKYPVQSATQNSCWFWAGNAKIAFIAQKKEWQGKDEVVKLAPKLLDCAVLAGLPEPKAAE